MKFSPPIACDSHENTKSNAQIKSRAREHQIISVTDEYQRLPTIHQQLEHPFQANGLVETAPKVSSVKLMDIKNV
jgi:hypothetical protein